MLSVNSLDVDINGTPILRDINLNIQTGEIIGLIGRNGAGKTTFLRSLMGLLPSLSGNMNYEGENLGKQPGYKRAHLGFGYMPEDRKLVPEMTAEQNILVPVWSTGIDDYEDRLAWIYKIIPECQKFRSSGATALSGGQQKLVALARALMVGKNLLLLDEPTGACDAKTTIDVERALTSRGFTVILVSHDPIQQERFGTRRIILTEEPSKGRSL